MKPRRSIVLVSVAILVALLTLAQAQAVLGLFGTLWRTAVVSWDNPATQVVDELACQTLPHTDSAREAHAHTVLATRPSGKIHASAPAAAAGPALPSRFSRSPPSA